MADQKRKIYILGAFAVAIIAVSIFGYRFLAGENLFGQSKTIYTYVDNAKGLIKSSPVFLKGFQIGTVTGISFKKVEDKGYKVVIQMRIDEPVDIKSDAVAQIMETGFVGGKAVRIVYDPESDAPTLPAGGTIRGESINIIEAMVGSPEEIQPYAAELQKALTALYDTLREDAKNPRGPGLGKTFHDMDIVLANLMVSTAKLNQLISNTNRYLGPALSDLATVTHTLKTSNEHIATLLEQTAELTTKINRAGLDSTIITTNETIKTLKNTLATSDRAIGNLNKILRKVDAGDNSMAKLLNDPQLYNNLNRVSRNLDLLLQDMRLNPKRYIHVSVFGKKQKAYVLPKDDPAFNDTPNH